MPKKDTVLVSLSRAQAVEAARWLTSDYRPQARPPFGGADWPQEQHLVAQELARILAKAARRKRIREFSARIPRGLAQWFAAFFRPDGWWDFGDVQLPAQQSPDAIQQIATAFLAAVSRRKGRAGYRRLHERERQLERVSDPRLRTDARWIRRLKKTVNDLRKARDETKKAGRD